MIGKVLDSKYEILSLLGEGGMGAVYEALHVGVGRRVAVKVLLAEDLSKKATHIARFQREARLVGGLETRHICQVLDTGSDEDGHPYMVMELMRGRDVAAQLKASGPLHPQAALAIVVQACRGLQRAHEAGVIHRDIKPANLFLCEEEDGDITVKVLDFGIAKMHDGAVPASGSDPTLTRTGALLGSPLYMSPEQARGKDDIDVRSDLFSLGVVLYRMLSGRAPFQDIDAFGELLMAICTESAPPLQKFAPWVEPEVVALTHRALAIPRDARFQSASEFLTAAESRLPAGFRLRREHLAPLEEEVRKRVAVAIDDASPTEDTRQLGSTHSALANTHPDTLDSTPSKPRSRGAVVLGAGLGFLAVLGGGFFALGPHGGSSARPDDAVLDTTGRPDSSPNSGATSPADSSEAQPMPPPSSSITAATSAPSAAMAPAAMASASGSGAATAAAPASASPRLGGPLPQPGATQPGNGTVPAAPTAERDPFGGRR